MNCRICKSHFVGKCGKGHNLAERVGDWNFRFLSAARNGHQTIETRQDISKAVLLSMQSLLLSATI